jgi:predicted XRE-type DNA-binding protein
MRDRPTLSESAEHSTIYALRLDMALQLARHVQRMGLSQVAAAQALSIPQPTLSKIIRGRIADLSLELLIRIATRAQLPLVLQTGKDPAEAGVFVSGSATPGRPSRSRLADRAREQINASTQRLSPEQRLDAQLRHCELLADLRRGAESANPKSV